MPLAATGALPDTASAEDLRRFLLYLVDQGTSPITLNATLTGLKFFFDVTLGRGELMAKMQPVRVPQKLPVVLSPEEVALLTTISSHPMQYAPVTLPFKVRQLSAQTSVAVSQSGDHALLSGAELDALRTSLAQLPIRRQAELSARFFLGRNGETPGMQRLLLSRLAARRETVGARPSLHIIVPTLQCAHSCRYCQVSRSLLDDSHALSPAALDAASDAVFQSTSPTIRDPNKSRRADIYCTLVSDEG